MSLTPSSLTRVGLRRTRSLATGSLACIAVLASVTAPITGAAHADPPDVGSRSAAALPFDKPSTGALRGSAKKAFAHWVPSLPVSLDNAPPSSDYYARNYLSPYGEGSKHAAHGGFLRDRPLGRDPIQDSSWRLRDMENEVRQAISVGLDGFSITVYQLSDESGQQWENLKLMLQAASNVDPGFKIILQPDLSDAVGNRDAGSLARSMAELARYPAAYRLGDGRLVFSPFLAERHDVAWWSNFMNIMRNTHGIPIAFVPMFLDERPYADDFDAISYGMGIWGGRNPNFNHPTDTSPGRPLGRIAKVRSMGQKWVQAVSVQDSRPREGVFDEAENTTNLRYTWQVALNSDSEYVQLNTWNDLPEGSGMLPSMAHGWSWLDINAYYLTWWKTGSRPAITRDTVYLSHRKQPWGARPSFPQSVLMGLRGGSSPARDTVEALTFLTAPGTVQIRVGGDNHSCNVPAGPGVCTVPLSTGTVSASVVRNGSTTTSVTSPYEVTWSPFVQDLEYQAVSSGRSGTRTAGAPAVAPPVARTVEAAPAPAEAPAPARGSRNAAASGNVSLSPVQDTYANQGSPNEAFGWSSSLSSRGDVGAISYLRFALPAPPPGRRLTAAELRVHTSDLPSAGSREPHLLRLAGNDWDENSVTWNNRPPVGAPLGTIRADTVPNSVYRVPVDTDALRTRLGADMTMAITNSGRDSLWLWSGNHVNSGFRPELRLTFR